MSGNCAARPNDRVRKKMNCAHSTMEYVGEKPAEIALSARNANMNGKKTR
jgi:hypothetical protein